MHSISLAHGFISLVLVLIGSVTSSEDIKPLAAFRVQSYAASAKGKVVKSYDESINVDFTNCVADGYPIDGKVTSMTITPCHRSSPQDPCTFVFLNKYTIELDFQTSLGSTDPRSSLIAYDQDGAYQYSGQSFNGCQYAVCPIQAGRPSTYVYHFKTLASPFSSLTFNVTQSLNGPSLFCASTKIKFEEKSIEA